MGLMYENDAEACPRRRRFVIIQEHTHEKFEEKLNEKVKELGNQICNNLKLKLKRQANGHDSFVVLIEYYEKQTEEQLKACEPKCEKCDTLRKDTKGQWIFGKFYCNKCLKEIL